LMSSKAFAVNYTETGNVFISTSEIENNTVVRNAAEFNTRTLSRVIAHETGHSMLADELGYLKYKMLPAWKNEGYCDYLANESSFEMDEGFQILCNNEIQPKNPSFLYFKHRLNVDYLLTQKKEPLNQFLQKSYDLKALEFDVRSHLCE